LCRKSRAPRKSGSNCSEVGAQAPGGFKSVDAGHDDIEQDKIWLEILVGSDAGQAILDRRYLVLPALQSGQQEFAVDGGIFDDENFHGRLAL
jgi:hypothetical protein